jgi:hypothetical protein
MVRGLLPAADVAQPALPRVLRLPRETRKAGRDGLDEAASVCARLRW